MRLFSVAVRAVTLIPSTSSVELVITAPEPYASQLAYATRARITLGVLTQLCAEARQKIVFAAPFVQAKAIFKLGVLGEAIKAALGRGVSIDIMSTKTNLNLPEIRTFANLHREQVRLFYPAFPSAELSELGSHAKFCIRDEDSAYVGSANLTKPGLGAAGRASNQSRQHFEMGVLISGGAAAQLYQLWVYTVRFGIFEEYFES